MTTALGAILMLSCTMIQEKLNTQNTNKMEEKNEEIVNVALMYIKDGEEHRFEEYKKKGGAILENYWGKIERIIKPTMLAEGELDMPDEIHFATYPSIEVFNKFNEDPEFVKIREE